MTPWLPFAPEKNAWKHTKDRAISLVRFDEIRVMQLLETVQYGALYFFLGFFLGAGLEVLFPKFNEDEPVQDVISQVLGQSLLFIVLVFYIRKLVKLVPFLFVLQWDLNGNGKVANYKPYRSLEYSGELTIGLVVVSSQINLMKKIDLLSREVYSRYMGYKDRVKSIF